MSFSLPEIKICPCHAGWQTWKCDILAVALKSHTKQIALKTFQNLQFYLVANRFIDSISAHRYNNHTHTKLFMHRLKYFDHRVFRFVITASKFCVPWFKCVFPHAFDHREIPLIALQFSWDRAISLAKENFRRHRPTLRSLSSVNSKGLVNIPALIILSAWGNVIPMPLRDPAARFFLFPWQTHREPHSLAFRSYFSTPLNIH